MLSEPCVCLSVCLPACLPVARVVAAAAADALTPLAAEQDINGEVVTLYTSSWEGLTKGIPFRALRATAPAL